MGKLYKTAKGKLIDLTALKLKNETTPTVGNVRRNARGDELGQGGVIVKTRNARIQEIHRARRVEPEISQVQEEQKAEKKVTK